MQSAQRTGTPSERKNSMGLVMHFDRYRPGQHEAHNVLYDRVVRREPFTALVLPTRYGKTDVIRGTAIHCYRAGLICCSLVLSPGVILRDQVVNQHKWKQFADRYAVDLADFPFRSLAAKNYLPES